MAFYNKYVTETSCKSEQIVSNSLVVILIAGSLNTIMYISFMLCCKSFAILLFEPLKL